MVPRAPMSSVTQVIGRYAVGPVIASGGMARVHLGHLVGPAGFSRLVAIKHMHPHLSKDADFVSMFLDEARVAARIRHTNVVSVLDVLDLEGDLYLVMDYVHGESLSQLLKTSASRGESVDVDIAVSIVTGVLHGLHAAHEAKDENGALLSLVHRDVSPQNVLVGCDGVARVVDFGVAKASGRLQSTRDGQVKGKLAYMAPEQILEEAVDSRTDVYAASVILWELLTGRRLFQNADAGATVAAILAGNAPPPSWHRTGIPRALDDIVGQGMASARADRFASALEMALALEKAVPRAPASAVSAWVESSCSDSLAERAQAMHELERSRSSEALSSQPHETGTQLSSERGVEEPAPTQKRAVIASIAATVVLVPIALGLALLPSRGREPEPAVASGQHAVPSVSNAPASAPSQPPASSAPGPSELGPSPCERAACKPEVLAGKLLGAAALAVDHGWVYFATTLGVSKVSTSGGQTTSLAQASRGAYAVAVLGEDVYFSGARDVQRVPTVGGQSQVVAETKTTVLAIRAHESGLYFTADGAVHQILAGQPKARVLAASQPDAFALAIHESHVYFTRYAKRGAVLRVPVAGGEVEELASGLDHPAAVAVDATGVYVVVQDAGRVMRFPHGGGRSTVVTSGLDTPTGLVVDRGWLYVTAQNAGTVSKLPAAGGKLFTLASGQSFPTGIASDSQGVYWVSSGPSGAVVKVSK